MKINTLAAKISLPLEHSEAISLSNFSIVLKSLLVNISKLDKCGTLIGAVLQYQWLEAPKIDSVAYATFVELYAQFLGVLVSSFPKYLSEVIRKLVQEFPDLADDSMPHHNVLKRLVTYIPTCINAIPSVLAKNFPHHLSSSTADLTNYVNNSMKLISYCPDLQFNLWQIVVECCIKLDVDLQNELDDLDDDSIEDLINGDDEVEEDDDVDMAPEGAEIYTVTSTKNIKKLVSKLDSLLELLLINTNDSFTLEEMDGGNGVRLFNTLTSLFKTHILPTHFTKLIQFLMFHISQHQPELADSFLVMLIDVAFSPNETTEKRLKAMQYLSSYIARAKNLTKHQVVFIVSYLIGWINKYITEREHEVFDHSETSSGGMERFKLFYAAFQALLYIFCFRHQQLTKLTEDAENSESEWECDLDKFFQRVIIAKFNPLKFCDETVVFIFAKLATKMNVCYCYSIIEHNKRERMMHTNSKLPSSVGNFRHKQEFLDLEAYFPFDPLVLPASKKIISANYVEWSAVNPSNDDDDDDEDSGSHPEDDDDDEDDDDEDIENEDIENEDEAEDAEEDSEEENTSDEEE